MEEFFLLGALDLRGIPQSCMISSIKDLHVTGKQSRWISDYFLTSDGD